MVPLTCETTSAQYFGTISKLLVGVILFFWNLFRFGIERNAVDLPPIVKMN